MNPFEAYYFGDEAKKLFGIYYSPITETTKQIGAIFLNPVGREYLKMHKGLIYLAKNLSALGLHVFRFDYYGTGDSYGDTIDCDLNVWLDNIQTAIEELKEGIHLDELLLIGWNIGASLAIKKAVNPFINGIILINPVINGEKYLKNVLKKQDDWIKGSFTKMKKNKYGYEYMGFVFSNEFIEEISNIDLSSTKLKQKLLILCDPGTINSELLTFQKLNMSDSKLKLEEFIKDAFVWEFLEGEKLPFESLDLIKTWIYQEYNL